MLNLNIYALWAIIIISITFLLSVIIIVCVIMYSIEKKYFIINKCMENDVSYKQNLKRYNKKLEKAGIISKKQRERLLQILLNNVNK